jgi:hypothetical protein
LFPTHSPLPPPRLHSLQITPYRFNNTHGLSSIDPSNHRPTIAFKIHSFIHIYFLSVICRSKKSCPASHQFRRTQSCLSWWITTSFKDQSNCISRQSSLLWSSNPSICPSTYL